MIERGHSLEDIRGFTLHQLQSFSEAAMRAHRRGLADELSNLRAAQFDKNTYKAYRKALTDGI